MGRHPACFPSALSCATVQELMTWHNLRLAELSFVAKEAALYSCIWGAQRPIAGQS